MVAATILQAVMSAQDSTLFDVGFKLSMIGMSTVFIGLVVLALSLPLIRKLAEGKKKQSVPEVVAETTDELSEEHVIAITTAIHAHFLKINQMEDMKLTWKMYEKPYSPWRLAGRSRMLMNRTASRQRSR